MSKNYVEFNILYVLVPLSIIVAWFIYVLFKRVKLTVVAPVIVLLVAGVYNLMTWDRIAPRDFTADQAKLIEYKNRLDPQADLLAVGYSYSVSSFYSVSKVTPIPKEEMRGFFDSLGYKYAIITLGDLRSLKDKENYQN